MSCASGKQQDAGLCYNSCRSNYAGVGPVCWERCPAGMFECGALCVEDALACTADILAITIASLELGLGIGTGDVLGSMTATLELAGLLVREICVA